MERLLRGCMQLGGIPEAEDCVRNWWSLRDAALEYAEVDAALIGYLERWYQGQTAPPDLALVREYFERDDKIDVVDRLEEVKRAQWYIRTNYQAICRQKRDEQEKARFVRVMRVAANIADGGISIDKRTLRGVTDATAYLHENLAGIGQKTDDITALQALDAYATFLRAPRMSTRIPALDTSFGGGGFPTPRLVVLGGAPGAGKTSLAIYLAHEWMRNGHPCAFLAVDEGHVGVAGRLAALEGLRDLAEPPPTSEFATQLQLRLVPKPRRERIEAQMRIGSLPCIINETVSVEVMTERLLRFAEHRKADRTPVLIVDSLQRVRTRRSDAAPDPRQRVDSVVAACKQAARRGVMVVATSEVNRGSYRSKKAEEQVSDLAATKESGAIEYGAETLLILRATQHEDVVAVTTPKNRGGKHPSFRLRLDRERMSYVQIEDEAEDTARDRIAADAEVLKEIVRTHPGIKTVRELRAACQAGGELTKHERIDAARAYLELQRVLTRVDGAFALAVERTREEMIA